VPTPTPNAGPVFAGPLATNTPSIALALNYETDFTCPGSSRVSIQATVSDPDGIASVELWWKRPKDTAFSKYPYPVFSHVTYWSTSIGQFFGRVYDVGTVSFYAVATDTKGAFTQSQTGSVEVLPCPEAS